MIKGVIKDTIVARFDVTEVYVEGEPVTSASNSFVDISYSLDLSDKSNPKIWGLDGQWRISTILFTDERNQVEEFSLYWVSMDPIIKIKKVKEDSEQVTITSIWFKLINKYSSDPFISTLLDLDSIEVGSVKLFISQL